MKRYLLLVILSCLFPASALAAPVQTVIGATAAGSQNTTPAATGAVVGANHFVVGAVISDNFNNQDTLTSVTDDKGNTYTLLDHVTYGTNPDPSRNLVTFYKFNITNGPSTLTGNFSDFPFYNQLVWAEYAGFGAGTIVGHGGQSQLQPGTTANAITSGSVTSVNGPVVVGIGANKLATTPTAGTGFTIEAQDSTAGNWGFTIEDKAGTGGTVAATLTDSHGSDTSQFYLTAIFVAQPSCTPGSLALMGMGAC